MTIDEIVGAIHIHVFNAIGGQPNQWLGTALIRDEINLVRAQILEELGKDSNSLSIESDAIQEINCVDLSLKDIAECEKICPDCNYIPCNHEMTDILHFKIPKLASISSFNPLTYVGTKSLTRGFKIYTNEMFGYHQYRFATGHRPFVFLNLKTDCENNDGFLFNVTNLSTPITQLRIRGIFSNPFAATDCSNGGDCDRYPASDALTARIIDTLVNKYVQEYKQAHMYPVFRNN